MNEFNVALIGDLHIGEPGGYDARTVKIPDTDLTIVLGDLVDHGTDSEYTNALKWIDTLKAPATFVRGNHDNGDWSHHIPKKCLSEAEKQLDSHRPASRLGAVVWEPLIWRPCEAPILSFPENTADWNRFPGTIQPDVIKLRDLTPAWYSFAARGLRFICLDTSNWILGKEQLAWLKSEVEKATDPVVIVAHHHCLPVDIRYDCAQIHEREELRALILNHSNVVAYLNGHAHKNCWWQYGNADIITTTWRTCRTLTFRDGRIAKSSLSGRPDTPRPFSPCYLCTQTMTPGKFRIIRNSGFESPWKDVPDSALGWVDGGNETGKLSWTMTLPENLSPETHQLVFQLRNSAPVRLDVSAPGLNTPTIRELPGTGEAIRLAIDIGPLRKGTIRATLTCGSGWGYSAATAFLIKNG